MFSSSSSLPLQPSISQLSLRPFPLLPSLPFEPRVQPNIISLLPQVEVGATAPPHAYIVFLAAVFPRSRHHFVKYWSGWGKT